MLTKPAFLKNAHIALLVLLLWLYFATMCYRFVLFCVRASSHIGECSIRQSNEKTTDSFQSGSKFFSSSTPSDIHPCYYVHVIDNVGIEPRLTERLFPVIRACHKHAIEIRLPLRQSIQTSQISPSKSIARLWTSL